MAKKDPVLSSDDVLELLKTVQQAGGIELLATGKRSNWKRFWAVLEHAHGDRFGDFHRDTRRRAASNKLLSFFWQWQPKGADEELVWGPTPHYLALLEHYGLDADPSVNGHETHDKKHSYKETLAAPVQPSTPAPPLPPCLPHGPLPRAPTASFGSATTSTYDQPSPMRTPAVGLQNQLFPPEDASFRDAEVGSFPVSSPFVSKGPVAELYDRMVARSNITDEQLAKLSMIAAREKTPRESRVSRDIHDHRGFQMWKQSSQSNMEDDQRAMDFIDQCEAVVGGDDLGSAQGSLRAPTGTPALLEVERNNNKSVESIMPAQEPFQEESQPDDDGGGKMPAQEPCLEAQPIADDAQATSTSTVLGSIGPSGFTYPLPPAAFGTDSSKKKLAVLGRPPRNSKKNVRSAIDGIHPAFTSLTVVSTGRNSSFCYVNPRYCITVIPSSAFLPTSDKEELSSALDDQPAFRTCMEILVPHQHESHATSAIAIGRLDV